MTDINASLKKTIDGEPGPQYKEKNKAEFKFIEGEDGTPYSYDKKVESRLTAIEDKLDSVIENGSVNTQLTGSNVAIKNRTFDQTMAVNAQSNKTFVITPPENEIWKIKMLRVLINGVDSATKGSHKLIVSLGGVATNYQVYDIRNEFDKHIQTLNNTVASGGTSVLESKESQQNAVYNMVASKDSPLYFYYSNDTDALKEGNFLLRITKEVVLIG